MSPEIIAKFENDFVPNVLSYKMISSPTIDKDNACHMKVCSSSVTPTLWTEENFTLTGVKCQVQRFTSLLLHICRSPRNFDAVLGLYRTGKLHLAAGVGHFLQSDQCLGIIYFCHVGHNPILLPGMSVLYIHYIT